MSKLDDLRAYIRGFESVAVAFSSGVDSTLLLHIAHEELKDRCIAVTAKSAAFPDLEYDESVKFCKKYGIRQIFFESHEVEDEEYASNPKDRCYRCKHILFGRMLEVAEVEGVEVVLEGSNADDTNDYRPGMKAVKELGIKSPLVKVGLTKQEIRRISKDMGLPTFDKPSFACLASRFPYGERITKEGLTSVAKAEEVLKRLGLRQYRVRHHGNVARIEVEPQDFARFMDEDVRTDVYDKIKACGFDYVALDLKGYRTGSMNEVLKDQ